MEVDPSDPSYSTQLEAEKTKVSAEVPPPLFSHAMSKLTKCKLFLFQWAALMVLSGPDCLFGSEASSLTVSYECSRRPKIELYRTFRGNADAETRAKLNMDDVTMCSDGTMANGPCDSGEEDPASDSVPVGAIIGASLGALVIVAIAVFLFKKSKKKIKEGKKSALKYAKVTRRRTTSIQVTPRKKDTAPATYSPT